MPADRESFRAVLGRFASGVTVVTARVRGQAHGMTASAFTSVSLDPPLVLVCVDHRAKSNPILRERGAFTINVLAADQQAQSDRFASRGAVPADLFDGIATVETKEPTAGPVLADALAYLDCRIVAAHEAGDHTIYVGEVGVARTLRDQDGPILYYRGRYRRLAAE